MNKRDEDVAALIPALVSAMSKLAPEERNALCGLILAESPRSYDWTTPEDAANDYVNCLIRRARDLERTEADHRALSGALFLVGRYT